VAIAAQCSAGRMGQGLLPALAQDTVVATATLPRDLSPWGMFLSADSVVKGVLIGLAFASLVTWTVWLAKSIEIFFAKRRVRAASKELAGIRSLEKVQQLSQIQGEASIPRSFLVGTTHRHGVHRRVQYV
jgi:hypothetical protein